MSDAPDLAPHGEARGAREALRSHGVAAVVAMALLVGIGLRVYHLDRAPRPLQTADEYAWTWAGMSLLSDGVPASWSYLSAYSGGEERRFGGQKFTIVRPWLDHPPLFALVMGAWARLGGYRDPYTLSLAWMRALMIALWVAGFVLFVLILAQLFDPATMAASAAVFAVAPPLELQSKLVVSENLFVPLFLFAWWCLLRYHQHRRLAAFIAVLVCALALPLVKIPALSLSLVLLIQAWTRRERRLALAIVAATGAAVGVHMAWGAHFGWSLFRAVQEAHARRFVGFNSGLMLLFGNHIVDESVVYPLWFVGALGIFVDALEGRGRDLYLMGVVYAGCLALLADQRSVYGWYWLPYGPAFAAGVGSYVLRMWRSRVGVYHAAWAVIATPWLFNILVELRWDDRQAWRVLFAALMIATAGAIVIARRGRSVALQPICALLVALELAGDFVYVLRR